MVVSIIVAMAENNVIGRDMDLPWHISADLKRFKALTMGHHIVMGRKTYESIGRLLPGRTTVIITRQENYQVEGAVVVNSLEEAQAVASADSELFIIGGGVSKKPDKFFPYIELKAKIVPAEMHNDAGIVGAALSIEL